MPTSCVLGSALITAPHNSHPPPPPLTMGTSQSLPVDSSGQQSFLVGNRNAVGSCATIVGTCDTDTRIITAQTMAELDALNSPEAFTAALDAIVGSKHRPFLVAIGKEVCLHSRPVGGSARLYRAGGPTPEREAAAAVLRERALSYGLEGSAYSFAALSTGAELMLLVASVRTTLSTHVGTICYVDDDAVMHIVKLAWTFADDEELYPHVAGIQRFKLFGDDDVHASRFIAATALSATAIATANHPRHPHILLVDANVLFHSTVSWARPLTAAWASVSLSETYFALNRPEDEYAVGVAMAEVLTLCEAVLKASELVCGGGAAEAPFPRRTPEESGDTAPGRVCSDVCPAREDVVCHPFADEAESSI
jgi:hypothetical protein